MKATTIKLLAVVLGGSMIAASCKKNDTPAAATVYYELQDQIARPAINTVFVDAAAKDSFNTTVPSQMAGKFGAKFKNRLLALNPSYTTNLLTYTADQFSGALVTDVLNVSTTGPTTFFDGVAANTLSGRALTDDVIDVELILIFGGPANSMNAGLTSDNVSGNDKAFLTAFPYLASPF